MAGPWERYQQIDRSRPIIENSDGSFSTERTITASFNEDGQEVFYNIPKIVDGRDVGEEEAIRLFQSGENKPVGRFGSLADAESAAVSRSARIGEVRERDRVGPWTQYQSALGDEPPPLEIDVVGGTPVPAAEYARELGASDDLASGDFEVPRGGRVIRPSLFSAGSDFRERSGVGLGPMIAAAARDMFGGRDGAASYLAEKAGGRVGFDERGQPTVMLPTGEVFRTNDPGIDSSDLANFAGNAIAFAVPAGWAARLNQARGFGVGARAAVQGATAGATDVALQATLGGGDIDPVRVAGASAGGVLGEGIGTGIGSALNRVMAGRRAASPQNLRAASNLLEQEGLPAAAVDARRLAPQMEQIEAGANPRAILGADQFGFQYTRGQRTLDPVRRFQQQSREEVLRQSPGGAAVFDAQRAHNRERLGEAVTNIGESFGARGAATASEAVDGAAANLRGQADALREQIGAAYDAASAGSRAAISAESVAALPGRLRAAVSDMGIDPVLTPAAARTLENLEIQTGRLLNGVEGANVSGVTLRALEQQRRIINNHVSTAANATDRRAMTLIKNELDEAIGEAVETALVSGDASALQSIREARALRAEFGRRFEGRGESDRFIAGLLDGSRTPEEMLNAALGASQVSKAAGARFIERLRVAANDDPEIMGALQRAHFERLAIGKTGEPLDPGKIIAGIRASEHSNASVVAALYTPEQWAQVRRLADALEPLVPRGDFAKSSGTAERMSRMLIERVLGGLPLVGEAVRGAASVQATSAANRAVNAPLRQAAQAPPGVAPAFSTTFDEGSR